MCAAQASCLLCDRAFHLCRVHNFQHADDASRRCIPNWYVHFSRTLSFTYICYAALLMLLCYTLHTRLLTSAHERYVTLRTSTTTTTSTAVAHTTATTVQAASSGGSCLRSVPGQRAARGAAVKTFCCVVARRRVPLCAAARQSSLLAPAASDSISAAGLHTPKINPLE